MRRAVPALLVMLLPAGCGGPEIEPLIGEPSKVQRLTRAEPLPRPSNSPIAAARRLHQALVQQNMDLAWALLARKTQRALDERGSRIGVGGRELLDSSTLPGSGGTVRKVRFEEVFFGPDVRRLETPPASPDDPDQRTLRAVSASGAKSALTFVRGAEGWRLLDTELGSG